MDHKNQYSHYTWGRSSFVSGVLALQLLTISFACIGSQTFSPIFLVSLSNFHFLLFLGGLYVLRLAIIFWKH